jgi:hypothetical protein
MNDNIMKAFPYTGAGTDGMDLRDYFAACSLNGFIRNEFTTPTYEDMAKACYELADAMMKARENHE